MVVGWFHPFHDAIIFCSSPFQNPGKSQLKVDPFGGWWSLKFNADSLEARNQWSYLSSAEYAPALLQVCKSMQPSADVALISTGLDLVSTDSALVSTDLALVSTYLTLFS